MKTFPEPLFSDETRTSENVYDEEEFSSFMAIRGDYEIENIEKMLVLKNYLNALSGSAIIDFLFKHPEINIGANRLACQVIYLNTPIYEKVDQATKLSDYHGHIPPLFKIMKKTREDVMVTVKSNRPWMINYSNRLLYSLLNEDYVTAADCLRRGLPVNKEAKNLVAFFYEPIFRELRSNDSVERYIDNSGTLAYIYNRIKDNGIKITFYYDFSRQLNRAGIAPPEIDHYEEYHFLVSNIKGPFDREKITKVLSLADELVKMNKEREFASQLFAFANNRYIDKFSLLEAAKKLPDNTLLLLFAEDSHGRD